MTNANQGANLTTNQLVQARREHESECVPRTGFAYPTKSLILKWLGRQTTPNRKWPGRTQDFGARRRFGRRWRPGRQCCDVSLPVAWCGPPATWARPVAPLSDITALRRAASGCVDAERPAHPLRQDRRRDHAWHGFGSFHRGLAGSVGRRLPGKHIDANSRSSRLKGQPQAPGRRPRSIATCRPPMDLFVMTPVAPPRGRPRHP